MFFVGLRNCFVGEDEEKIVDVLVGIYVGSLVFVGIFFEWVDGWRM